eukprot:g12566.t1
MNASFRECAETTQRLHDAVLSLERECALLQIAPLEGREWFELLRQKLLPQLRDDAFLVVAVVGGTNIGKSVIFNHLAGCRASATSPLASGTKHPVCLVPPGFVERHELADIFEGFTLEEWSSSEKALKETDEHLLFWRPSEETPENLLVLDTPDIDSDAPVNWQRADHIRRSADVLIAVLTQQKYNDAAVKQFFRKAAEEDKAILVVFNQCQLPEDDKYWPLWLDTFCSETGIDPEFVYVAPSDREAAEENRLPFYERDWPLEDEPKVHQNGDNHQRSLSDDLSQLRFQDVKLRTLRGSLNRLLDGDGGVPAYLGDVRKSGGRFQAAADILSKDKLARLDHWPSIPNSIMVSEVRRWWQQEREGWSAKIHGFYNTVGSGVTWPFRFAKQKIQGDQLPPIDEYRKREWKSILDTVEEIYDKFTLLSHSGNALLEARLEKLLGGMTRSQLLQTLESAHVGIDIEAELRDLVSKEMESFRDESPKLYTTLKRIDKTAAAVRPAASVVLFLTGFGPAGDAAAHVVADSAIQSVVHVAGEVTGGTVAAAVGDQAISGTASSGLGYIEAKFRRLHAAFIGRRVQWLLEQLRTHLWGSLLDELTEGATISQSAAYAAVQSTLDELARQMNAELREPPMNRSRALVRRLLSRCESLRIRLEAPLIVATFGGTGTGKSTLVNALVGRECTTSGRQRPTTTRPILIAHPNVELEKLELPLDDFEIVRTDSSVLRDIIIIDCPDPDTTEAATTGSNLERLHRLLPLCDVLIYTSTQQKYRSARVTDELEQAATGCRLLFVQTHADVDSDIRDDWKKQLTGEYEVPDLFFVDSLKALHEQQDGLRPTGDFGRLQQMLTTRLAASQRIGIRRSNLIDLIHAALEHCRTQLTREWPAVEQLEAALDEERQKLTSRMSTQLRDELLASRNLWERRLLGAVTEKWGFSPFSSVLRVYHGLGSLIASSTLFRARTSAQMALIGAVQGARWLKSRRSEKKSDEQLERLSVFGVDDDSLREAQFVMAGYAKSARLDPALTAAESMGELRDEASRAQDQFLGDAGQKIEKIIDDVSTKNTGALTRIRYEILFLIYVAFILVWVGKNFFYDSFFKQFFGDPAAPPSRVLGWDFWVTAAVFFAIWSAILVMMFAARLRRGLNKRVKGLAEELTQLRLSHGLFPKLEETCRSIELQRHRLDALAETTSELRNTIAGTTGLGGAIDPSGEPIATGRA